MVGIIFTIIGAYTVYALWETNLFLAVISGIATIYQLSTLSEMGKEIRGLQQEDRAQTFINFISTIVILVLFISTFF